MRGNERGRDRRKELTAQYKQTRPEAGVYCIRCAANGRSLVGSAANLAAIRNKLAFAASTGMTSALDHRLWPDVRRYGIDAFSFEVLEVLDTSPEMTAAEVARDLAALEDLRRERMDAALLY